MNAEKKQWEKPILKTLDFKKTFGGSFPDITDTTDADS
jgi:hypothetical protein